MLMSHAARSAGDTAWPSFGASAAEAAVATQSSAASAQRSSVSIGCLPFRVDVPACDRVEVIDAAQTALGDKRRAGRLHHSALVSGAALQHSRPAVPLP